MMDQAIPNNISAIIVEDQDMFGMLIQHGVFEDNGICCLARCLTLHDARTRILFEKPDIVLLDNQLPDGRGIDLFREISPQSPTTHWVLCTAVNAPAVIREAVRVGIRGVVLKSSAPESILFAIREVMRGHEFFCSSSTKLLALSPTAEPGAHLTLRETEALRFLADGLSTKEIAEVMALTQKTVNLHVKNACDKLAATSYVDAVNKARLRGLV